MFPWLKKVLNFAAAAVFLGFAFYLLLPSPNFPRQLPDSVQSLEKADTETKWRRAYFTNYTRAQVLDYYQTQLGKSSLFGIPLSAYRLNYPPEDAFVLIRDQTRSTFLEEIVQPFKISFFVNGFKPRQAKDDIWYKGVHYEQKITVKYAVPPVYIRTPIIFAALLTSFIIVRELGIAVRDSFKSWSG